MQSTENNHILILRSTIDTVFKRKKVISELLKLDGIYEVSVDLDDWEKVLRVVCHPRIGIKDIEQNVAQLGYQCAELIDTTIMKISE